MTSSDPTVRQLLASAVDDHPIDLEARLGGIHEPSGRKPPLTRLLVGVAALAIAAAAVALVVWTFAVDRSSEPANLKRNGVIAFLAHHPVPGFSGDLGHTRIVTMNPDGTNVRVLRDVRGSVGSLSWSPDGSRLVFSNEARNFGRSLIDVMRADGDRLHPIRTCPTMVCLFDPAWSPRGDRIAFEQGADVFTITATGRDVRRLAACTSTKPADSLDCYGVDGISWSPDGKQIVFARRTIASHLFLVQSNGRGLHQITACGSKLCLAGEGDGMPAWSPDGRQIAFQRERNIFVVRPDGSGLRQVTRCPHVLSGNSVTCEAGEPAWAPDGTKIVFRGIDGLYVMNADGTHQRRIGPRNASSPAWAPQAPSAVKPTPSPKPIETIAEGPALDAITFADATHGWAGGAVGILATSDGGRTWQPQDAGGAIVTSFDFLDGSTGWAVGVDRLLRTTNGGATWTRAREPDGWSLTSTRFLTPTTGFGIATPSTGYGTGRSDALFRSTDGGMTWSLARRGPSSMCFVDERTGYAGEGHALLKTTDGGVTWNRVLIPPVQEGQYLTMVQCPTPDAVWFFVRVGQTVMNQEGYVLLHSGDGGASFQPLAVGPYVPVADPSVHVTRTLAAELGPFRAMSGSTAVFLGFCPACDGRMMSTITVTADGGRTFQSHGLGEANDGGMWFRDASHGFVAIQDVNGGGRILRTDDGGRTWTVVYSLPR